MGIGRSPRPLQIALWIIGLVFLLGVTPLTRLWPGGWVWHPNTPSYLHMILSIYATLGIFLMRAARDPLRNASLVWFTVWSSVAHGSVMAVHAFTDPGEMGHLVGDVAAMFFIAAVLSFLMVRAKAGSAH